MQRSTEKLYKIFKLEAELNYTNRAVVGGLEKLIDSWQGDARAEALAEEDIQQVVTILKGYADLSTAERPQALRKIGDILDNPGIKHLSAAEPQTEQPLQIMEQRESQKPVGNPTSTPQKPSPARSRISTQKSSASPAPIPSNSLPEALSAPTSVVHGIGQKQADLLSKLGLDTIEDLIYYFPRRYDDYSQLKLIKDLTYGEEVTIIACVDRISSFTSRNKNRKIIQALVSDNTGSIQLMWFNQTYHLRHLRKNMFLSISGKIEQYMGRLVMYHPDYEKIDQEQLHTKRIVPVYSLTARLNQRWLRRVMFSALTNWAPKIPEFMTEYILEDANLMDLSTALKEIHFPESHANLDQARYRLAFDEIFLLQLGVLRQKHEWVNQEGSRFPVSDDWLSGQLSQLPYDLTSAQHKALGDLRADLDSGRPMNRLLQGDVGSGKTVIAGLGVGIIVNTGAQAAYMAPTSILAEQHYHNLRKLLADPAQDNAILQEDQVRLLIGDTPAKEREDILAGLADGRIKLIIGTHALIEDPVQFNDLQFVVVDEQHRFGVAQRSALREKGHNPHLLVMTATPIPRSLALTVYGDLDLSILDEMPPGRQPVKTYINYPVERERIYNLVRTQVKKGRQAFIIYPLVEQGENEEVLAAVEEQERLQAEVFPNLRVGLLHGRLRPDEKETVMRQFRDRQFDILVSTTVIEVGVDIPNATIMIIEGANRFGLAQLHQLRGRIGRGEEQSYCFLIPQTSATAENERLLAMQSTHDGFVLAEYDLQQRGPGEFLGTRQSGYAGLRLASLTDVQLIEKARRYAQQVFENDPALSAPEHQLMREALEHFWPNMQGDIS
jgi:ATP-dependent DNA helicase RecG